MLRVVFGLRFWFLSCCGSSVLCCFVGGSACALLLSSPWPFPSSLRLVSCTRRHVKRIRHERDSVEINHNAPQWSHNGNVEPEIHGTEAKIHTAATVADSEPAIGQKSSPSCEVKESDILRAVAAIADLPSAGSHPKRWRPNAHCHCP